MSYLKSFTPLAQACSLCPIQNSKFIIQNTPFGKLSEFAKVFYTPNSKFKIQNSQLPQLHCKIFAKIGKIPPPIVKIMLNFTMYNVKFFIFSH